MTDEGCLWADRGYYGRCFTRGRGVASASIREQQIFESILNSNHTMMQLAYQSGSKGKGIGIRSCRSRRAEQMAEEHGKISGEATLMAAARRRGEVFGVATSQGLAAEEHTALVKDHSPDELLLAKLLPLEPALPFQIAASGVSEAAGQVRTWRRATSCA